jgi:flagellar capping protein FliD
MLSGGSSAAISDLFNSSKGVATQMKARMDDFVSTNGILDGNDKGVKDRLSYIDKKIADYTARNAKKVADYQLNLAKAQALLQQLSTQTQLASSYASQVAAGG